MPTDLHSFFRYVVPGTMYILCIAPWFIERIACLAKDKVPEILTVSALLAVPTGILFFFVYFSFYHILFEKQIMQAEEQRVLHDKARAKFSERWRTFFCDRQGVSRSSAAIWYYVDSQAKIELSNWLRHTFAVLHSLGACFVAIVLAHLTICSGLMGPSEFSHRVYILHAWGWGCVLAAMLLYRYHYKIRYTQRLHLFIMEKRADIAKIEKLWE